MSDTFQDFITRERDRLHAEREQIFNQQHELEQKLAARRFVRIHRSTLLNLAWVGELHSWFGGQLVVRLKGQNTVELTVARDRVRTLKEKLGLV